MTRKRKVDAKSVEPKRSKRLSGAAVSKDAPSSKPISSATRSRQRPVASKEAEHNGARLTRLRARDLGKAPLQPDQEPERLLRQAHKAETTQEDKGKEADMELRPSAGAGPDQSGGGPDDDDGARHGTLQGLLRRFGAGFDDIFPGGGMGGGARLKGILAALRNDDETQVLTGLTELCEYVSISTEESMMAFPTEQVVPLVVSLMSREHNPDLMLLATRALTFLADVFPPSCSSIIRHGAVPAFCTHLMTIEYIDLAEQSLQALEKLSHDHAVSLLRAGGLVAVLSYIDFFQTGVQRVAAATAANICRGLTPEHVDAVSTAAPILINLLQYQDGKIVDSACLALTRIAEAFSRSPAHMETLCGFGLINSIVDMVAVSETGSITSQLSSTTFYGLIKLLATCASSSHVVAEALLQAGVSSMLRNLLATSPMLSSIGASPGNALRSAEQLQDLISLASQLLPPVADASAAMLAEIPASPVLGGAPESTDESGPETCALTTYLAENPDMARRVAQDLFPVMLRVYEASATPQVKRRCLTALAKMLHHTPADTLRTLLADLPVSSLIATLLGSKDPAIAAHGMQAAEILMGKLPDVFTQFFLKEGVVHAMEQLATAEPPPATSPAPAAAPVAPAVQGVSTRRRSQAVSQQEQQPQAAALAERAAVAAQAAAAKAPAGQALRTALGVRARHFCTKYFKDDKGDAIGCATDGMRALTDICARFPEEAAISDLLRTLAVTGDASVSTFELLSSGTVRALRVYLQGDDIPSDSADRAWRLLERLGVFAGTALPPGSGSAPPALVLVDKLQAALAAREKFAVQLNNISMPPSLASYYGGGYYGGRSSLSRSTSGASGSLSAGLAALGNPFKIRLAKAADEPTLRDYSSNVVLIEPLASMSQVEDFLWPRVQAPTAAAAAPTGVSVGGSAAAAAASDPHSREAQRAAGVGRDASTLAGGSGPGRQTSKQQPIPQPSGRRLTRAQARAAAEAEVAAQAFDGDAEEAAPTDEADAMSEDLPEDLLIEPGSAGGALHGIGVEGDLDEDFDDEDDDDEEMGDEYVEGDGEDYEDDEDGMLDAAAMHVHDMHLGEEEEAPAGTATTVASAPSGRQRSPRQAAAAAAAAAPSVGGAAASSAARTYAGAAATGLADAPEGVGAGAPHLAFYLNGTLLPTSCTIFQAVQGSVNAGSSSSQASGADVGSRLWGEVHTLTYRTFASAQQQQDSEGARAGAAASGAQADLAAGPGANQPQTSPLAELLSPCKALEDAAHLPGSSADVLDILAVLRVTEAVNRLAPHLEAVLQGRRGQVRSAGAAPPGHVSRDAFVNAKLGPKMAQQLKDVLSICGGSLPPWCDVLSADARFLFPFDVRRRYFYCTSFGLPRALLYLQQAHAQDHGPTAAADRDTSGLRMGRVPRQKVRISRRRLLDSAHKVFELYATPKSQLEIEFFNEVGTGLGPTLEFYTLLSHELQRRSLGLWRDDGAATPTRSGRATDAHAKLSAASVGAVPQSGLARSTSGPGPLHGELQTRGGGDDGVRNKDLTTAPLGLFPAPLTPGEARGEAGKAAQHFRLLGRIVAKALQDCRLLDLPLSPVLYRLLLGRRVGLHDVRAVDAALGASLARLHAAERAGAATGRVLLDGCPVEDLCLSFVLPGRPDYELCPGGADLAVTSANLGEYVDAVVDATLGSGVATQVAAFRTGFACIFPPDTLAPFYEDEIEAMLCGTGETWTAEGLAQVIKFDHGYTLASVTVTSLLEVLVGLDPVDQRRFLRFVTGTPRLPAGGLGALQPRLTVVRKLSSAAAAELGASAPGTSAPADPAGSLGGSVARAAADGDLPSVMTCANYLKLPPYSSTEVLRERLLFAIREGQGSFDLS